MKKIQLIILAFFLTFSFISCKKDLNLNADKSNSDLANELTLWLTKQKMNNNEVGINKIELLISNLIFDKLWIENGIDNRQFFIVPISEGLKLSNNSLNKVSNYLVYFTNIKGEIENASIIQYKQKNNSTHLDLDYGVISNIYSGKIISEDCSIRVLNIYDNFKFELRYSNNHLDAILTLKKINPNSNFQTTNSTNLEGQIDWYWVTTYYYPDGTSQTVEVYLYTTFNGQIFNNPDTPQTEPAPGSGGVTATTYPGHELGYPNEWWLNLDWIKANIRMGKDEDPTPAEIALIILFPAQAVMINNNATIAQNETIASFGTNGLNNASDAFRHAYWQALNTKSAGGYITGLFASAHETGTPSQFLLEKQMDTHNNNVGISITNNHPGFSNSEYSLLVLVALNNGSLVYLTPINYSDPCYWGCAGNPLGTHGITTQTHLEPTP